MTDEEHHTADPGNPTRSVSTARGARVDMSYFPEHALLHDGIRVRVGPDDLSRGPG